MHLYKGIFFFENNQKYVFNSDFESFFGCSLRELGISFHSLAPVKRAFFEFQVLRVLCKSYRRLLEVEER